VSASPRRDEHLLGHDGQGVAAEDQGEAGGADAAGRVAYPAKLDWDWPRPTGTSAAVRTQTGIITGHGRAGIVVNLLPGL